MERFELQEQFRRWTEDWSRQPEVSAAQGEARFAALALQLFAFQFNEIAGYQAFCRSRGLGPANVQRWQDIPLVPVSAFKHAALWIPSPLPPTCIFETSGTSDGQPGRLELRDTANYDLSLHAAFAHFVVPDAAPHQRYRCISLVPGPLARPHSSLRYMVQRLAARWDDGGASAHLGTENHPQLDVSGTCAALQRAVQDGRPVLLFATSIALELWLMSLPPSWSVVLPAGSRVMDTGGPKGKVVELSREAQHHKLTDVLGLPPGAIVGELGMTELLSQRYETSARAAWAGDTAWSGAYAGPPWLRSVVLDPATGKAVAPCEVGMVGHLDLANLETCAFVLTADLARHVDLPHYPNSLILQGRVAASDWRGCGLDVEMLLGL